MYTSYRRRGCISSDPHGAKDIKDYTKHYLGCIEIWERREFFDPHHEIWKHERKVEERRIRMEPELVGPLNLEEHRLMEERIEQAVNKKKRMVAQAILEQYDRTDLLRNALNQHQSQTTPSGGTRIGRGEIPMAWVIVPKSLVQHIEQSRQNWMESRAYSEGIGLVREERLRHGKPIHLTPHDSSAEIEIVRKVAEEGSGADNTVADHASVSVENGRPRSYRVEDDVNAHVIQFATKYVGSKSSTSRTHQPHVPLAPKSQVHESGTGPNESLPPDTPPEKVLEPFEEADPRFKGGFPNQRIALKFLLQDQGSDRPNPRHIMRAPERMQYFHVPSNNMEVSKPTILPTSSSR